MKTEACSSQMCTFFMLPCIPVAVLRYCSSRLTRVSFLSVFSIYLLSYFLFYSVSCLLCLALTFTSSPVIILYLHPCFISLLLPVCPQVVYIHSLQTAFKCLILRAYFSTRCWKHSSANLVHIDVTASLSCCRFVSCTIMM